MSLLAGGVMREHYLIEGQRKDQQVWGLLRSEWEARRSRNEVLVTPP